jgi:poly(hydroxyalkanoate) granule-associated protein
MPAKPKDSSEEKVEEKPKEKVHRPLFEMSRKMLLASIGAMSLAQNEIEAYVNKLVEHGEIAEKDGRKLVREMLDKRKERAQKVQDEMNEHVQKALKHFNIPTKADMDALNDKITNLMKKIDQLNKNQS